MAFNPFSGTSANFYAVAVSLTSGTDLVVGSGTPVLVYEAVKYDLDFSLSSSANFVGFNSDADPATRVLFKQQLAGGVVDWSVTIEGANSADAVGTNSYTRFKQGQFLYFHIVTDKSTGFGYRNLTGKVTSFTGGADVNSQEAQPLRLTIKGSGPLYAPTLP